MKNIYLVLCISFFTTSIFAQNSLNFDGVNDRVNCANDTSIQISGTTITLEAWIFPTAWQPNVWQGNIINKEQNNPDNGYMLRCGAGGRLNFNLGNGGWNELTTDPILSLNTWTHVAGTYDGSMMRVYVNGVAVDSLARTITLSSAASNLTIGNWSDPNFSRPFIGSIDEIRIWSSARTKAQLLEKMNSEFCTMPIDMKANYRANEGIVGGSNPTLTTLIDFTPNDNDGVLTNFALTGATSNWAIGIVPSSVAQGIDTRTECDSLVWVDGITYTTNNNTATYYLEEAAANGCDSLVTLDLTIVSASTAIDTQTACGSYTWIDSITYTASIDTATFNIVNGAANGCDSIVTLNLTVFTQPTRIDTQTACGSYTWIDGNTYTASNNTATFNVAGGGPNGCDTVITLDLTIDTVNLGITQSGATMTSAAMDATYQWLDCDSAFKPIVGATDSSFTPTVNGNYAVEVTQNGCTDTSACTNIMNVGLDNQLDDKFIVYPNPTKGKFVIEFEDNQSQISVKLMSIIGQQLKSEVFTNSSHIELSIESGSGVYFIELTDQNNRKAVVRVMKE